MFAGALGAAGVIAADQSMRAAWLARSAPNAAGGGERIGSDDVALALVRTTLATLNDANRTGNYEVLRALSTPEFATRNPAAALARTFAGFRQAGIDLAAVSVMQPALDAPPARDHDGRLTIAGRFPGKPLSVVFRLTFADNGGRWRPHAISIRAEPVAERVVGSREHARATSG